MKTVLASQDGSLTFSQNENEFWGSALVQELGLQLGESSWYANRGIPFYTLQRSQIPADTFIQDVLSRYSDRFISLSFVENEKIGLDLSYTISAVLPNGDLEQFNFGIPNGI